MIRQRLAPEVYERVFGLILMALKNKLLKGKRLAIGASVRFARRRRCASRAHAL